MDEWEHNLIYLVESPISFNFEIPFYVAMKIIWWRHPVKKKTSKEYI